MGEGFEESKSRLTLPEAEVWNREDFLAQARLLLGVVCIIAVCFNPESLGKSSEVSTLLLLLYFTYSLINLIVLRFGWHYGTLWMLSFHAADVVVISLIAILTGGVQSTFLGLFLFVLLGGACKWGFNGALLTSLACVAFLTLPSWTGAGPNLAFEGTRILASLVLSVGLISSGCLLGVLVEREQRRAEDVLVIARFVRTCVPQPSFTDAVASTLKLVRQYFDADQVRLALQEIKGDQAVAWDITRETEKDQNDVRSWKLTESLREASFAMPPEEVRRLLGVGRAAPDGKLGGRRSRQRKRAIPKGLPVGVGSLPASAKFGDGVDELRIVSEEHAPFGGAWSMLATSFAFEGKWLGRLTVYNPRSIRNRHAGVRFLETLLREIGPAMLNKFKVGRLRSRAQARERMRLVQELHDGIVQSLIGLEMQMDHLRRTQLASADPAALVAEVHRLQLLLHSEIASVREEMQRIKPLQVEPSRFIEYISGTVDRFQRDQGISAKFVAEPQEITLSPRVCTELVRIVQEALVNVRKHSGARKVVVSFGRENGHYKLFVEDDGRGFGFAGLLSAAELDASPKCPSVVRERVRAIGGELMIESTKASGARLEILVPVTANGRISVSS